MYLDKLQDTEFCFFCKGNAVHSAHHEMTGHRRSFMRWLMGGATVILGAPWLQEENTSPRYLQLDGGFLIVDGWVLPSSYFK